MATIYDLLAVYNRGGLVSDENVREVEANRGKLNFELLASTIKWAAHEHEAWIDNPAYTMMWRQGAYVTPMRCGTAACIAGRVALDAGFAPSISWGDLHAQWVGVGEPPVPVSQNGLATWREIGRVLLGLSDWEADKLFSGGNSITCVEAISRDIARYHGYEPTW